MLIPILAQVPVGTFDNLRNSEITGDQMGYEIQISKKGNAYSGTIAVAEGELQPSVPLQSVTCNDKESSCKFRFQLMNDSSQEGVLFRIRENETLFSIPSTKSKSILYRSGKKIDWKGPDAFTWGEGNVFEKPTATSKVLTTLPPTSKIQYLKMTETDELMVEIQIGKKKGFLPYENYGQTTRAIIVGEKVRFRKEPNTKGEILLEFPKWEVVGWVRSGTESSGAQGWIQISYKGQLGYVSEDFIASEL